jgi:hypothetical protein
MVIELKPSAIMLALMAEGGSKRLRGLVQVLENPEAALEAIDLMIRMRRRPGDSVQRLKEFRQALQEYVDARKKPS